MIEAIFRSDLWFAIAINFCLLLAFYFRILRERYLDEAQVKNWFYLKSEVDDRVKGHVSEAQYYELKELVKDIKKDLKEDFRALSRKLDGIILNGRE